MTQLFDGIHRPPADQAGEAVEQEGLDRGALSAETDPALSRSPVSSGR